MIQDNLFFLAETKKKTLVSVQQENSLFVVYHDCKRIAGHNHVDSAIKTAQKVVDFYNK